MAWSRNLAACIATLGVAAACSSQDGAAGVTYADLCAGAPPVSSDGTATMESCPWLQQADNITKYGDAESGRAIFDGDGMFVANVASTCDKWSVATDPQGVTIILGRVTGAVISHGTIHPGQPISTLPTHLTLPLHF
ncbi:MAG TPA: hypothetical protein VGH87_30485 [Polyangiaceae bacterium]